MNQEPAFIDNRQGNTLAKALRSILMGSARSDSETAVSSWERLRIATAFFSPSGFAEIADQLTRVPDVRLLLGADLAAYPQKKHRNVGETQESFERQQIWRGLQEMSEEFVWERDRLPFTRSSRRAISKLVAALRSGNLEVRRYEKTFLHAKAYIFTPVNGSDVEFAGLIAGSSNLTRAGLAQNLELNIGRFDSPVVKKAVVWFDELWNDAELYDLAEIFETMFVPRSPWEIFVRVLYRLYAKEIEDEQQDTDTVDKNLQLTSFQQHGVVRALRLIRETGGVIVADEVGLGKTFIAGEILNRYTTQRQRTLLVCPAALRDSTWKSFLAKYQLYVECLSFEQLARDKQLRDPKLRPYADQRHLERNVDEYQLVIIDEAHNYRNPITPTRAAVLRRLLFGKKRDLLLLTATPVNNSLWDLYHLIRFFIRQDAQLAKHGILSIRKQFNRAMRVDPSDLSPDVLYPIIDATTVKRTRQFVKKHYSKDTIPGPDGHPQTIVFPKPQAITVRYALEDRLPGFLDKLESALDSNGANCISFARYTPDDFRKHTADSEENARARALVGLLRSGLLKRFESSAFAFQKTVGKMVHQHEKFLEALDAGVVVATAFLQEISADDVDGFEELLHQTPHRMDASNYDAIGLRKAVERDLNLLRDLLTAASSITPSRDTKLRALADALIEIAQVAENEATNSIDEAQKRKVLVFSSYADTVECIHRFLKEECDQRLHLASYRDRIAAVSGTDSHDGISRRDAVLGFAPVSMQATIRADADLYDLLITTDVLAEGVNLQQCRHIINYDMPWNPMRLVQRHGRIDRIGSPHNRVFLRTIFPVDRLDQLLNLEQRILGKLAMAAASVGVAAPIEGAAHGEQVFTEARLEIEKLMKEDSELFERGGTVGAAQTGEEYRQTLRKALAESHEFVRRLPWKVGSGMAVGQRRGIFFCAVVGEGSEYERTYVRFIQATDTWQPDPVGNGTVRELGTCLRLIECESDTPTWFPEKLLEGVYEFWDLAKDDIWEHWNHETDPANLQPLVRPLNHRVADFIRTQSPRGLLSDEVDRALDILESPWPRREEFMLRAWFDSEEFSGVSRANFLVENILQTGLEPMVSVRPLPPIQKEDIELYCWMGIDCA